MKRVLNLFQSVCAQPVFFSAYLSASANADTPDKSFVSRTAEIDGVKLHYTTGVTACADPAAWLPETSRMWTPSSLCWREIYGDAPTAWHRGLGDPRERPGHETAAIRIHGLARSLGVQKARWSARIAHVAYAYARIPAEVEKLL